MDADLEHRSRADADPESEVIEIHEEQYDYDAEQTDEAKPEKKRAEDETGDAEQFDEETTQSTTQSTEQSERTEESEAKHDVDDDDEAKLIVTLKGLPYQATVEEIMNFLEGCIIVGGENGIHIANGEDGRPNGNAFVELASQEDVTLALGKNKNLLGRRYIEVFQVDKREMDFALRHDDDSGSGGRGNESIVRVRGLPFGCTKEEVANFFLGLAIAPNGITILTDHLGRTAGDGFVQFTSADLVEQALKKHKEKIKHRYIEVYRSSRNELEKKVGRQGSWSGGRPGPYDRPSRSMGSRGMGGNVKGLFDGFPGDRYGGRFGGGGGSSYGGRFGRGMSGGGGGGGGRMGGGYGGGGGGYGGGGRSSAVQDDFVTETGHFVHMRGLPFSVTEDDIAKFFDPLVPANIVIEYFRNGRKTGNANVDFHSARDAKEALKKHRSHMDHRYIELYLNTTSPPGRSGGRY